MPGCSLALRWHELTVRLCTSSMVREPELEVAVPRKDAGSGRPATRTSERRDRRLWLDGFVERCIKEEGRVPTIFRANTALAKNFGLSLRRADIVACLGRWRTILRRRRREPVEIRVEFKLVPATPAEIETAEYRLVEALSRLLFD